MKWTHNHFLALQHRHMATVVLPAVAMVVKDVHLVLSSNPRHGAQTVQQEEAWVIEALATVSATLLTQYQSADEHRSTTIRRTRAAAIARQATIHCTLGKPRIRRHSG